MVNTTWNPSDLAACTLSGGNLVATSNAGSGGVRSVHSFLTGKRYWEVTLTTLPTTNNNLVGISVPGASFGPLNANATNGIGLAANGSLIMNGSVPIAGFGSATAGSVVCVAVDADARLIWVRRGAAGNWNNNVANNPATGVGGQSFAVLGPVALYAWAATGSASGHVLTANFGDTAFTGAVPSGFASGFNATTPPVNAAVTQAGLEEWTVANPLGQITQVSLEQWVSLASVTVQAVVTQASLEQWVKNAPEFSIVGNELRVANPVVGVWPVIIRVTDDDGNTLDKAFSITITP